MSGSAAAKSVKRPSVQGTAYRASCAKLQGQATQATQAWQATQAHTQGGQRQGEAVDSRGDGKRTDTSRLTAACIHPIRPPRRQLRKRTNSGAASRSTSSCDLILSYSHTISSTIIAIHNTFSASTAI